MNIKGAIFDMDGTLVDSLFFWGVFWRDLGERFLDKRDYAPPKELDLKVRTMIFSDAMAYVRDTLGIKAKTEEVVAFAASTLANFYRYKVKAKAGVYPLLEGLKAKGVRLALASATDMRYLTIALDACRLTDYFDTVLSCADLGVGKEKPDIYLLALEKLGIEAADSAVFEDSYVALETAKSIGCHTVGIFDQNNFGQDRLQAASELYLEAGVPLDEALSHIEA
ncbi:MAG: HAD family phosphatase [Ruminococcaceae bacterium]|nr:HAD family phosphatase [Oscillospiraceae bacterium]